MMAIECEKFKIGKHKCKKHRKGAPNPILGSKGVEGGLLEHRCGRRVAGSQEQSRSVHCAEAPRTTWL
jgi:hypothetical protein